MSTPLTTIDLKRLAAEVSVLHGIRIDPDDPMLAVVTLNRMVFEQAVAQVLESVQTAVKDFDAASERVQVRAGGVLAQEVRQCAQAMRQEFATTTDKVGRIEQGSRSMKGGESQNAVLWRWMFTGLILALVLVAVGVMLGTLLCGKQIIIGR